MSKPPAIEALSTAELKAPVVQLLDRVSALSRVVAHHRDEIAHLKGLKGWADIKRYIAREVFNLITRRQRAINQTAAAA